MVLQFYSQICPNLDEEIILRHSGRKFELIRCFNMCPRLNYLLKTSHEERGVQKMQVVQKNMYEYSCIQPLCLLVLRP